MVKCYLSFYKASEFVLVFNWAVQPMLEGRASQAYQLYIQGHVGHLSRTI